MSDALLATIRNNLFTAVIGDVLDAAGFTRQFLPPHLRAVSEGLILVGRAMTVQETDIAADEPGEPFGVMFKALPEVDHCRRDNGQRLRPHRYHVR